MNQRKIADATDVILITLRLSKWSKSLMTWYVLHATLLSSCKKIIRWIWFTVRRSTDDYLSSPNIAWVLEDIFYCLFDVSRLFYSRVGRARVSFSLPLWRKIGKRREKKCKQYTGCARKNTTTESILGSNPHLTFVLDENIAEF